MFIFISFCECPNCFPIRLGEKQARRREGVAVGSRWGGDVWDRGEGGTGLVLHLSEGTETQTPAQSSPVLLALSSYSSADGDAHLLAASQQDVHQLHMGPFGEGEESVRKEKPLLLVSDIEVGVCEMYCLR